MYLEPRNFITVNHIRFNVTSFGTPHFYPALPPRYSDILKKSKSKTKNNPPSKLLWEG